MDLRLAHTILGESALVSCAGTLDVYVCPQLKQLASALLDSDVRRIVTDLRDTQYVDSTAIGIVIGMLKLARVRGKELVFVIPAPRIRRVFEITGLYRIMEIVDTVEEAMGPDLRFLRISCPIPACGGWTPPIPAAELLKRQLACADCATEFELSASAGTPMDPDLRAADVNVWEFRTPTYEGEYIEFSFEYWAIWISIVGRLDVFASESFARAWTSAKWPERVLLNLNRTKRVTKKGLQSVLDCYKPGDAETRPRVVADAEVWNRLRGGLADLVQRHPDRTAAEKQLHKEHIQGKKAQSVRYRIAPTVKIEPVE